MRPLRGVALLGVLVLATALSACGSSPRSAHPTGGAPSYFLKAIETGYPEMAYLPSRLPKGFRYDGSRTYTRSYDIYYDVKGIAFGTTFEMYQAPCRHFGHARHTFVVNGRRVEWSTISGVQQAWLCLTTSDGHPFGLSARAAVSGDRDLSTPRHRRDARRLATLVADALPAS